MLIRRAWRYQRGSQNPYIEEQKTQWPKEKDQKDKQRSTKHTHQTKDRVTRTQLKTGRVSSSCSTSGTRRVNLVTNPVISHEWGKDREVFATSGTYPWSFVTQIFHNGQPCHGGYRKIFEVMTSILPRGTRGSVLPRGTLGSVASLLAVTLYQGNLRWTTSSGISYQLRDKYSICRWCWNVAIYKWKVVYNGKIKIISFVVKFRC